MGQLSPQINKIASSSTLEHSLHSLVCSEDNDFIICGLHHVGIVLKLQLEEDEDGPKLIIKNKWSLNDLTSLDISLENKVKFALIITQDDLQFSFCILDPTSQSGSIEEFISSEETKMTKTISLNAKNSQFLIQDSDGFIKYVDLEVLRAENISKWKDIGTKLDFLCQGDICCYNNLLFYHSHRKISLHSIKH